MKAIIVPTDFSPTATNAMHYAIHMAAQVKANLILTHVYQIPVSYTDAPIVLVSVEEIRKSATARMQQLKADVEHLAGPQTKVYIEIVMGSVVDELENLCNKVKPFAVVMGAKGASGVERVLFGSNTLLAIRRLTWPVICVPPGKTYGKGIKKIGFACDFDKVVDSTPAPAIKELVKTFGAHLDILNINPDGEEREGEMPEQSLLLQTMMSELKPAFHFIQHRDIEDGINEFAIKNELDLVITIPKKHNLIERIFKETSSKQLIYHGNVPILCMHE
jgi:nucleotide-binding universal stress UspA family protein